LPLGLELVRGPLQEEHTEDVLLELGRVHPAPQDVSGSKQVALQLSEGEFVHPNPHPRDFSSMTVSDCVPMSKSAIEPFRRPPTLAEWCRNYQFILQYPSLLSIVKQEANTPGTASERR